MTPHTPPIRKMTRRCARATGRQSNTVQDEIMQMSRSTRTHRARLIRPVCRLRITSRGALYIYRCPMGTTHPPYPTCNPPVSTAPAFPVRAFRWVPREVTGVSVNPVARRRRLETARLPGLSPNHKSPKTVGHSSTRPCVSGSKATLPRFSLRSTPLLPATRLKAAPGCAKRQTGCCGLARAHGSSSSALRRGCRYRLPTVAGNRTRLGVSTDPPVERAVPTFGASPLALIHQGAGRSAQAYPRSSPRLTPTYCVTP